MTEPTDAVSLNTPFTGVPDTLTFNAVVLLVGTASILATVKQGEAMEAGRRAYESSDYAKAVLELQAAYWRKQFGALTAQAEEVRALSTKVTADAGEPLKAHVKRGVDELGRGN